MADARSAEALELAPGITLGGCRARAGLSDVQVLYAAGACVSRCATATLFSPTPVEATRQILRDLGLRANAVRAFVGEDGQIELRLTSAGNERLARVFGLAAGVLNAALREA